MASGINGDNSAWLAAQEAEEAKETEKTQELEGSVFGNNNVFGAANFSLLFKETAQYYSDNDGVLMTDVRRVDGNGQTVAEFSENSSAYNKRLFVERNYTLDRDNNGITELDMSSGEISQLYSLMMQDSQYSELVQKFGKELNSQGIFDNVYNALRGAFGASNAESIADEIQDRSEMVPVLENFFSGNKDEALLSVGYDETNPKTQRLFRVGVRHQHSDQITSQILKNGTKKEILDYLKDPKNSEAIKKSVIELSEYIDKNY